jgi:DNA invertase Pin-like site-specific DNA recombinase
LPLLKTKRAGIYVRVSTGEQDTAMQEAELKECAERRGWEIKVYRDHGQCGAQQSRPALEALLSDVRRGIVSVVMVWSLDRLARSLHHLLELSEEFRSLNVDLFAARQAIDTSSAAGRLTYQVLGAVAEFEREMLRERVKAGLQHARAMGRKLGRPPLRRLTTGEIADLRRERKKNKSPFRVLANKFGVSVWTAHTLCGSRAKGAS